VQAEKLMRDEGPFDDDESKNVRAVPGGNPDDILS